LGKMDRKEVDAIMQITTSWHEKGRAEGRLEKAREVICKYLAHRFGDKSAGLQREVQQVSNIEALDFILEKLFAVNTLEEARALINDGVESHRRFSM